MGIPLRVDITESCTTCTLRGSGFFCELDPEALLKLQACSYPAAYPRGAVLFVEGQMPRGVFLLCRGRVKLTINSREGKTLIFKIAQPGDLLGLSATVLDRPYPVTAETIDSSQLNFIKRGEFLNLLRQNAAAALHVAQQLGEEHQLACREMASLGLAQSAAEKLATLFLDWARHDGRQGENEARIRLTLTHEEMAQMIGTTRETVTRLLSRFKQRQLIQLNGSMLVLRNTTALQAVSAGGGHLEGR